MFYSNQVKHAIALELKNKISEKETKKLYKHNLPEVLSFDEFKYVKSADGAMSFHMVDGKTGKTIDIVEDRHLKSLLSYFSYFTHKARSKVKLIVIDMYSPYISLIKVIKRIAFGFRSFRRFKARIMICKNLLSMKKVSA